MHCEVASAGDRDGTSSLSAAAKTYSQFLPLGRFGAEAFAGSMAAAFTMT